MCAPTRARELAYMGELIILRAANVFSFAPVAGERDYCRADKNALIRYEHPLLYFRSIISYTWM